HPAAERSKAGRARSQRAGCPGQRSGRDPAGEPGRAAVPQQADHRGTGLLLLPVLPVGARPGGLRRVRTVSFLAGRLAGLAATLLGMSFIVYGALYPAPGSPISVITRGGPAPPPPARPDPAPGALRQPL